jgi:hypothetical protein
VDAWSSDCALPVLTHKTETGTANTWELLIANHMNQSLWLANQIRVVTPIMFVTLFSRRCAVLLRISPAGANCSHMNSHCRLWSKSEVTTCLILKESCKLKTCIIVKGKEKDLRTFASLGCKSKTIFLS